MTWHVTPTRWLYFTFSQGFRPGPVQPLDQRRGDDRRRSGNGSADRRRRPDSATSQAVPQAQRLPARLADQLRVRLKTEWFDHRLLVNGSAYHDGLGERAAAVLQPAGSTATPPSASTVRTTRSTASRCRSSAGHRRPDAAGLGSPTTTHHADELALPQWSVERTSRTVSPVIRRRPAVHHPGAGLEGRRPVPVPEPVRRRECDAGLLADAPGQPARPLRLGRRTTTRLFVQAGCQLHGQHVQPAGQLHIRPCRRHGAEHDLLRYKQPAYTTCDAAIGVSKDNWTYRALRREPGQLARQPLHFVGAVHQVARCRCGRGCWCSKLGASF